MENSLHQWHSTLMSERRVFADFLESEDVSESDKDFAREELLVIEEQLLSAERQMGGRPFVAGGPIKL